MDDYKPVVIKGKVYFRTSILTEKFCLDKGFVEDLVLRHDHMGEILLRDDELLVPPKVFMDARFPQDREFFLLMLNCMKEKIRVSKKPKRFQIPMRSKRRENNVKK